MFHPETNQDRNAAGKADQKIYGQYGYHLYDFKTTVPLVASHEAVHVLRDIMGENTAYAPTSGSPPMFEQGLANLIMYNFLSENQLYFDEYNIPIIANITRSMSLTREWLKTEMPKKEREESEQYVEILQRYLDSYNNISDESFISDAAFDFLAQYDHLILFGSIKPSDEIDPFESTWKGIYTSTSFTTYLYQKGTKEDFLRVFHDLSLMEEVYGKALDAMIQEWKEFLDSLYN